MMFTPYAISTEDARRALTQESAVSVAVNTNGNPA